MGTDRTRIALEKWPLTLDAIEKRKFKSAPFLLGIDEEGKRWECDNLREYASYALSAYIRPEQFAPLDSEPQERAEYRMELIETMLRRRMDANNKASG